MSLTRYNLTSLLAARSDQKSFHVASEEHVRVEFRNLSAGEVIDSFRYGGDVVLTCYKGAFTIEGDGEQCELRELDQLVAPAGTSLAIRCVESGSLQMIWAPAFAATSRG